MKTVFLTAQECDVMTPAGGWDLMLSKLACYC